MKLEKLELSAILGLQARNRELMLMAENIKAQLTLLEEESQEVFTSIESRLKLEEGALASYEVNPETGELVLPPLEFIPSSNGHNSEFTDIMLEEID